MEQIETACTSTVSIYPWQHAIWKRMVRVIQTRCPSVVLLTGISGLGKSQFALQLAQLLLCKAPHFSLQRPTFCGQCRSCQLWCAKTHTDFHHLPATDKSGRITVDCVRELIEQLHCTSQQGGRRVVLLDPAHAMNKIASNALLKTLEEPKNATVFLLVSDRPQQLLATIRSRCHWVPFRALCNDTMVDWLERQNGQMTCAESAETLLQRAEYRPLVALRRSTHEYTQWRLQLLQNILNKVFDPLQATQVFMRTTPVGEAALIAEIIQQLQWIVLDVLRLQIYKEPVVLVNTDFIDILRCLSKRITYNAFYLYYNKILELRHQFDTTPQLNATLFLERILIIWYQLLPRVW